MGIIYRISSLPQNIVMDLILVCGCLGINVVVACHLIPCRWLCGTLIFVFRAGLHYGGEVHWS